MKVLSRSEIDLKKWHSLALSSGEIYTDHHYLDAVTDNNWSAIVWGDYKAAFPFFQKKKFVVLPYLCMPTFVQKHIALNCSESQIIESIQYLKKKNLILDIAIDKEVESLAPTSKTNIVLNTIGKSYSEVKNNYHSRLLRNLKKTDYVEIHQSTNYEAIAKFVYKIISNNDKYSYFDKSVFKNIVNSNNIIKQCLVAKNRSREIIGVLLCPQFQKKLYITFPFVNEEGRKQQAMSFLIDQLIQNNIGSIIDFEGSSIKGIQDFYLQFGGEVEHYYSYNFRKL